jgi:ATP-dependent DNA helicase DinG
MSILSSFPVGKTPRPQQVRVLERIEEVWDKADVIVIDLPVASGKSLVSQTIARWSLKKHKQMSRTVTPTNILVEQYVKDFPYLHTLPSAASFTCTSSVERHPETKEVIYQHSCSKQKSRAEKVYCKGCPYVKRKRDGYAKPFGAYNLYTYVANQYYRPILIVDEAHNLIPTLRDLKARKFWQHEYGYPSNVLNYGQLFRWLTDAIPRFDGKKKERLEAFHKELLHNKTRFIVDRGIEEFKGELADVVKLLPVNVRDFGDIFWPQQKVQKVVLMSATITRKDIESLGLDKKRVIFLSAESAIPKERRPIIIDGSLNLSFKYQDANLQATADWVNARLAENPERGIIHVTYSLAAKLRPLLNDQRLLWHGREDKKDKYKEFLVSPEGTVLMACGLYEGIDLPNDLGRWQAMLKVPFPSLESPAIAYLAETDESWFANETIKVVAQMSGRVCRHPEDYGKTYILDSSFNRLYKDWDDLFPQWFKEAIVWKT